MRITKLNGLGDAKSIDRASHHQLYRGADYEYTVGTSTREMIDQPGEVLQRLTFRLARAFGRERAHFPYRPGR